ncbi:hypothetical protein JD507_08275 [Aeromonas jandaei]|uniref:hypothetical protein n=1 Tax=Aeromonas jandaei TaxID=650 RepID=UPI00191EB520|nr:hypothetical protein [Aeromonas jandaei]MBL0545218.1 hypothetical protein [Aeromonas jandaei]
MRTKSVAINKIYGFGENDPILIYTSPMPGKKRWGGLAERRLGDRPIWGIEWSYGLGAKKSGTSSKRGGEKAEADPTWCKRAARFAQIKKSRRYRNDKAGSSNKEWLYKQMLYSKD